MENTDPDCPPLNFVRKEARKHNINYALKNSFGFGGTNVSLLFKKWQE
jgi:3-oxoacyl-(acyl-carrier-protein) synthase